MECLITTGKPNQIFCTTNIYKCHYIFQSHSSPKSLLRMPSERTFIVSSVCVLLILSYKTPGSLGLLSKDDSIKLFEDLGSELRNKIQHLARYSKEGLQYGILYVPFEPAISSKPVLSPNPQEYQTQTNSRTYPIFIGQSTVETSYVITMPQYHNRQDKKETYNVHTEAQFIEDGSYEAELLSIYGRMRSFREDNNRNKDNKRLISNEVYLYTYNFPCPWCACQIKRFLKRYTDVNLTIGWTVTDWHKKFEKGLEQKRDEKELRNILKGRKGNLVEVDKLKLRSVSIDPNNNNKNNNNHKNNNNRPTKDCGRLRQNKPPGRH